MRWVMAAFYMSAGLLHLASPEKFLPIVPGWVPLPRETVLLTGVCEIAGSVALLIGPTMPGSGAPPLFTGSLWANWAS